MERKRIEVTGDSTKESWVRKQRRAGILRFEDIMLEGIVEISRDLAGVINRQSLEDLPMIVVSMHIMEKALRELPIWGQEADELAEIYERRFKMAVTATATSIPVGLEKKIEEWQRRKKEKG